MQTGKTGQSPEGPHELHSTRQFIFLWMRIICITIYINYTFRIPLIFPLLKGPSRVTWFLWDTLITGKRFKTAAAGVSAMKRVQSC